jgi:hypothetical protein
MTLKSILWKQGVRMWNGFIWLKIQFSGGLLSLVSTVMELWAPRKVGNFFTIPHEELCALQLASCREQEICNQGQF